MIAEWHNLAKATGLDAHLLLPIIAASIDGDVAERDGNALSSW